MALGAQRAIEAATPCRRRDLRLTWAAAAAAAAAATAIASRGVACWRHSRSRTRSCALPPGWCRRFDGISGSVCCGLCWRRQQQVKLPPCKGLDLAARAARSQARGCCDD